MPPRRVGLSLEIFLLYKHHTVLFAGVQQYAREHGWVTVLDDCLEATLIDALPGRPPYDGVLARVGKSQIAAVDAAAKAGIPVVNVLVNSPVFDKLPGVFPDLDTAARLRADHLLSRGLHRFACPVIKDHAYEQRQAAAFTAVVAAAGHSVTRLELPANWGDTVGLFRRNREKIMAWMSSWELPIGVASSTDVFARNLAQMCLERGWRVPEDVAIVGGMNEESICVGPEPSLTSVEMGYDRIGYEAARMLDRLMTKGPRKGPRKGASKEPHEGKAARPEHVLIPPVGLVVRESTDFLACDDELVAKAQVYISDHCHEPLEVPDVGRALGVTLKTLQARFTAAVNRTVSQEIRRVRIERAKRALASSDRPIADIAVEAGFTSNARLCDVFDREVGMSPRAYRRQRKA